MNHPIVLRRPVAENSTARSSRAVHPVTFLAIGLTLAILPAALSSDVQHLRWGTLWYIRLSDLLLVASSGIVLLAGLAAGTALRPAINTRRPAGADLDRLNRAATILFTLSLIGYGAWAVSAAMHGLNTDLAIATLIGNPGAAYRAREALVTVPGVSTLTEVTPALTALLTILWRAGTRRQAVFGTVLALATVRAFLNSERISLVMVAIPIVVAAGMTTNRKTENAVHPRRRRRAILLAVISAPATILAWFAITERGRSWNSHYASHFDGGLVSFSVDRLWAYYATATNNGVIYSQTYEPRSTWPELSLDGVANMPIIGPALGLHKQDGRWLSTLSATSNPELNNPGGVLPIIAELGVASALVFVIWGFIIGRFYASGRQGNPVALVGYAALSVGLLELPRYPYLSSSRFIVALIAVVILHFVLVERRPRRHFNEP